MQRAEVPWERWALTPSMWMRLCCEACYVEAPLFRMIRLHKTGVIPVTEWGTT